MMKQIYKVFTIEQRNAMLVGDSGWTNKHVPPKKAKKNVNFLSEKFTARISTPGLHMLSDADVGILRKVFWFLLFLGAIGITFWNISTELSRYSEHDTETSITIVEQTESVFPAVTICPRPSTYHAPLRFSFFPYRISFNGVDLLEDQVGLVTTVSGICLQLNGLGELVADDYGTYANIRIDTDIVDGKPFHTKYTAFQIYVQPHYKPPSSYIVSELAIPVNFNSSDDTEIRIQKIRWTHLNPDIGKCVEKIGNNASYSKGKCIIDCLSSFITNKFKCRVKGLIGTENSTIPECSALYDHVHEKHIFDKILHGYLKESKCKNTCPQECDRTTFSLTKYTTDHLSNDGRTFVMIYYETLDYQHIVTREAYDGWLLLCDVGGALGLLLGATLLTVVDILDFLATMALSKIRGKTKALVTVMKAFLPGASENAFRK